MPETIYTRSQSLDSKVQVILSTKPGNENHPLITHPNVTILSKVRVDSINADKPPGFDIYDINSVYYAIDNAASLGQRWADWFQYQGLTKGKGQSFGGLYGGAVYAPNFGTTVNGVSPKSIMFNPLDQASGYSVGFHANSILRNQGTLGDGSLTLGDFMKQAFLSMKQTCDNRNLCYPMYIMSSWDQKINASGMIGSPSSAPFIAAQSSSKFGTEIVYEEWNGSNWIGKTMADAFSEAGSPPSNSSISWFQGINRQWCCLMQNYYRRINDHALNKVLYEPAKEVFPNIICGNYGIVNPISNEQINQYWDIQENWWRTPFTPYSQNRYLRADYQSPICYSPDMTSGASLRLRYNPASNVDYPAPTFSGHIFGPTKIEVYRNYITQITRSCVSSSNPLDCIPWIEAPYEGTGNGIYEIHVADEEDILYIMQQQYLLGVRTWNVLNTSHGDSGTLGKTRCDIFLNTLNAFLSWVKTQNKIARVRLVS